MTLPPPAFHALPTTSYTPRIPSPSRIHIPAPLPDSRVTTESIPYSNPPTTSPIAQVYTSASIDWTYPQRRSAQPILSHLLLGPIQAAKDTDFLVSTGITLLLGIRQANAFQAAAHKKVQALTQSTPSTSSIICETVVADTLPALIGAFPRITALINAHAASTPGAKVLLFCESGNDRSAGACAAYLMSVLEGVDHVKAVQLVQSQRFCCNFDDGLKRLLQGYWDIVRAERQVGGQSSRRMYLGEFGNGLAAGVGAQRHQAEEHDGAYRFGRWEGQNGGVQLATGGAVQHNHFELGGGERRVKRGRERDTDEGAMEVEMTGDEERFEGRASWVPFVDAPR
ncbi:Hypothetical protein D9617_11g008060 [Elsinoe fawcettii]|nr:Hypothetical protein D9617_11g008060 [Elsinoe fawcettii]